MNIDKNIQRIGKHWIVGEPKTSSGRRLITLPSDAIEALRCQRIRQAERRLQAGAEWQAHSLVFTGELGQPLHPSVPQHYLRRECQRLGIRPMSPHGLRHLHASLLLSKGLPITAVSQRLGHANAAITMSVYAHALKKQDDEAAQMIQAVLAR